MAIALGKILAPPSSSSGSSLFPKTRLDHHSFAFVPVSKKGQETRLSAAAISPAQLGKSWVEESHTGEKNVGFSDSWMQDTVTHIVKNLKQSPLLVQVYSENGNVRVKSEKACPEQWDGVKSGWGDSKAKSETPDGLIFVEELCDDGEEDCDGGLARVWGIVVQGKGSEFRPACYLLKTNRVCGGMGLGCCTHFCLMRVKSFRDSALQQFQDSWLLN